MGVKALSDVLRQEKKLLITRDELLKFDSRLSKVLHRDKHDLGTGYSIRSLYFDTPYDTDYNEKLDGVLLRRKIRLRCYGPNQKFAKLEMKQKEGDYQRKRSLTLKREDAEKLCMGDYSPLLFYNNDFAVEIYSFMNMRCYRPKAIVEYNRRAFIASENNIRITFDSDIIATESRFDIFSEDLVQNSVFDSYLAVMEVKYNGFLLSYIKEMLEQVDRRSLSVSKYMLSRTFSYADI